MPKNHSGEILYVSPTGQAHRGPGAPAGSTVLVVPGGDIPAKLAELYGVADWLAKKGEGKAKDNGPDGGEVTEDAGAGEPVEAVEAVEESKSITRESAEIEDKAVAGPKRDRPAKGK